MLDLFKEFILTNIYWLLPVFISVVECFLIIIFKKRPVFNLYDEIWFKIFRYLPGWINEAEERFDDALSKLTYVLNEAVSFAPELFSQKYNFTILRNMIEDILSTPQKKGGN